MKKIKLTQGKFAIVDNQDFEVLSKVKWCVHKDKNGNFRAIRRKNNGSIFMHRAILKPPPNMVIDHINHNTLDNRRKNLRICTQFQNMGNSKISSKNKSGFKGVSWDKVNNKWIVVIRINGKSKNCGRFDNKIEAARIYNKNALLAFGDFACINNI